MPTAEELSVWADVVASVSSVVAIIAALIAWWMAARRPLRVSEVVVHRHPTAMTFIVVVKNVKNYPVTLLEADCYTQKKYTVERLGRWPQLSATFPGAHQLFRSATSFEVSANGNDQVRFPIPRVVDVSSALLFLLRTSHGYHELWCRKIVVVDIGKVTMRPVVGRFEYSSAWKARWRLLWEGVKAIWK